MGHASAVERLGLWRLTRHERVRSLYDRLSAAGLFVAQLDRFERPTAGAAGTLPDPPDDVTASVVGATGWVPDRLEGAPLAPGDRLVVATAAGEPVGWCCLSDRPVYVPELGRRLCFEGAYLWRLYVVPEERSNGVGTAIVARGIRAAREGFGTDRIVALVAPDNVPSRRAFGGLGFRPTERFTSVGCFGAEHHRRSPLDG